MASSYSVLRNIISPPILRGRLLHQFTTQLAVMLEAGMPLATCLRFLKEQCDGVFRLRCARGAIRQVLWEVEAGTTFSEALAQQPRSFSQLYVNLIQAGEASGEIVKVLRHLSGYMERARNLRKKAIASLIYPASAVVVAVGVIALMIMFVVPRYMSIFGDLLKGQELPPLTMFVASLSTSLTRRGPLILVGIILAVMVIKAALRTTHGKYIIDFALIRMPPFRAVTMKSEVARFSSMLSTLLNSGIPALKAMRIVQRSASNEVMKRTIDRVYNSIIAGQGISTPLRESKVFPLMPVRWMEVGEKTGSLADMLDRIAVQYEKELEDLLDAMVSLIEPCIIIVLAVVVGTVVIALTMPLLKIMEALGG